MLGSSCSKLIVFGIVLLVPLAVFGQPNNLCSDAIPVGDGIFPFDTSNATTDGDQPCTGQDTNDIWYVYTASADGTLNANTCLSTQLDVDTVITVWNTASCPDAVAGNELGCNDDACGPGNGFASNVSVPVINGDMYLPPRSR